MNFAQLPQTNVKAPFSGLLRVRIALVFLYSIDFHVGLSVSLAQLCLFLQSLGPKPRALKLVKNQLPAPLVKMGSATQTVIRVSLQLRRYSSTTSWLDGV